MLPPPPNSTELESPPRKPAGNPKSCRAPPSAVGFPVNRRAAPKVTPPSPNRGLPISHSAPPKLRGHPSCTAPPTSIGCPPNGAQSFVTTHDEFWGLPKAAGVHRAPGVPPFMGRPEHMAARGASGAQVARGLWGGCIYGGHECSGWRNTHSACGTTSAGSYPGSVLFGLGPESQNRVRAAVLPHTPLSSPVCLAWASRPTKRVALGQLISNDGVQLPGVVAAGQGLPPAAPHLGLMVNTRAIKPTLCNRAGTLGALHKGGVGCTVGLCGTRGYRASGAVWRPYELGCCYASHCMVLHPMPFSSPCVQHHTV